jgi:hypothetical protein
MVYTSEDQRVYDVEVEEVENYLLAFEEYGGVESREGAEIDSKSDIEALLEKADRATLIDDYNPGEAIGFSLFESQGEGGEKFDEILVYVEELDEDQAYREMIE